MAENEGIPPVDPTHRRRAGATPGPYGTNEGDIWTMDGSAVGTRLKQADNLIGVHEMLFKDGVLEERIYCMDLGSEDPEIQAHIAHAREGHEKWLAAQAAMN